jgi:hypothetical protein
MDCSQAALLEHPYAPTVTAINCPDGIVLDARVAEQLAGVLPQ